jgi:phosphatidylglycerol lysyltransferase
MKAATLTRDVSRARVLVLKYGWNVVAYQILNPGIYHWFSPRGDAVVGFVRHAGYWLAAGGPICARERLGEVVLEFEADVTADGCRICYFGAGDRLYDGCRNPPAHSVVALGAQPIWEPAGWPEIIRRHSSVRAQVLRARNKHVTVTEWKVEHASANPDLQRCLDEWLSTRRMPPMHFLVEPETLKALTDRRVFVAGRTTQSGSNVPVGFLVASPVPARNGWLIEQIIRGRGAPNGTNEAMLDTAMRALAHDGAQYVTLGLVPLARHAMPAALLRNPLWLRMVLGWVRAHGRRFFDFDGLERFKSKFDPIEWEPIFAITNEERFSPRALYAIAAAFSDKSSPVSQISRGLFRAVKQEMRLAASKLQSLARAASNNSRSHPAAKRNQR